MAYCNILVCYSFHISNALIQNVVLISQCSVSVTKFEWKAERVLSEEILGTVSKEGCLSGSIVKYVHKSC